MAPERPEDSRKRSEARWRTIAVVLALSAIVFGVVHWLQARDYETTDDAFIDAHVIPISAKISGHVAAVLVDDNQQVEQGQLLVEIEPQDFEVSLGEAKAELAAAQAAARRAEDDMARYKLLYQKDQVSKQTYDHAVTAVDEARDNVEVDAEKVQQATLNLSYTKIYAPEAGKVTKRAVELKSYVEVGQPLMALVPRKVWVTANFKETQLTRMRPGQPVTVRVDAYPGHVFKAHVDSIQSGTGSRFSLLPPENATGNYIKVVQRVPVKIVFDEPVGGQYLLAPGMSVEPAVKTR